MEKKLVEIVEQTGYPVYLHCDFCGEVDDNAIQYAGYCICTSCRKKIGSMKK